ncbi:MAG: GNAT family N-acetyltransferase [Nocardioides sp.]
MAIELSTPGTDDMGGVLDALRDWQVEGEPMQFHPGDVGWYWRFGAGATAGRVRCWSRDGRYGAIGVIDEPTVVRLAVSPEDRDDAAFAHALVADLSDPARGVFPAGPVSIETPPESAVRQALTDAGWAVDEAWTGLRRGLADPVEDPGVRIEVVGPDRVEDRVAVQRAAFDTSTFTVERWHAMAEGPAYGDARCLVAYDDQANPVATVTVWSAGPGRPGLLEPLGTHRDHRGRGYGRAISLAAAAALRDLGSSSAHVCTPSANAGGVATYLSAGFEAFPETHDLATTLPGRVPGTAR